MKSWFRHAARAVLVIFVVAAAVALIQVVRYTAWQRHVTAGLSTDSSLLTTARGPIEFIRVGDSTGVPILWLHGNPGGYDQLSRTMLARGAIRDSFASIVVSRPGYLRTPLESGATPEEQAHLFAALLDSLRIARVVVVGVSGGGPAAIQFARLHPERTSGLALIFAYALRTAPEPVGRRQLLAEAIGLGDWFTWRTALRVTSIPGVDANDTVMVRRAEAMLASLVPRDARRAGDENDQRQFDRPGGWPIGGIAAPAIVFSGTRDATVPLAHAKAVRDTNPETRLVMIAGDHGATVTRAAEIEAELLMFIRGVTRANAPTTSPTRP